MEGDHKQEISIYTRQHIPACVDRKLRDIFLKINSLHRLVKEQSSWKRGRTTSTVPANVYLIPGSFSFDFPAFLYQEYRDTSKQQEIEQRRQRENLSPEVRGGTVVGESGVMSPPVLQLQLRNSSRSLNLWQNLEAVQASGLLTKLPHKEIIMQEVSNSLMVKGRLIDNVDF